MPEHEYELPQGTGLDRHVLVSSLKKIRTTPLGAVRFFHKTPARVVLPPANAPSAAATPNVMPPVTISIAAPMEAPVAAPLTTACEVLMAE